jgi:hypothetical protein
MADILYATCTNTSNIISVEYTDAHNVATSTAVVVAVSTSLDIGDSATVYIGYSGDNFKCITGFVKLIELKEPEKLYTITIANSLIRAVDFYIAAENPEEPFSRQNISAENLIGDLLALSGLTNYSPEATAFTFAINNPVEVNLTGCYDYCRFLAEIIAFTLYADNNGQVHLIDRRPYPVGAEAADYTFNVADGEMIEVSFNTSDKDLRNKVIVYGSGDVSEVASAVSPYLPGGYYKTVVVSAPGVIDSSSMAQQAADYNLELLNRLTQKVNLTLRGTTGIVPRKIATVTVPSLGISGKWYVFAVSHSWTKAGYITSLELRK